MPALAALRSLFFALLRLVLLPVQAFTRQKGSGTVYVVHGGMEYRFRP